MAKLTFSKILTLSYFLFVLIPLKSQNIETIVQTGHYASVAAVCYSPDGKLIATGSYDKTIKLWRASDGKEIRSFVGSKAGVKMLEINKQGTNILSLSSDGIVIIWELTSGKIIKQFSPIEDDAFTCASFHPNGLQIVAGTKTSHIGIWDLISGLKTMEIKAISTDLNSYKSFNYPETKTVSFSNDGQFIIAGVGNRTAILWDARTGKELHKFKNDRFTCTNCFSEALITADNNYIITTNSDSIVAFNRVTGKPEKQLGAQGGPECLRASSDGRYISAIEYGVAEIWNLASGKLIRKISDASDKRALTLAFSPDGKQISTGNEMRTTDIWNIISGQKINTLKGHLNQVDERLLSQTSMYWAAFINEAKLSPDGRFIAVGRTGNNVKLIDFKTGKVQNLVGHSSMVISVNFSTDGKYLATGGLDGKAIIWDVETGKPSKIFRYRDSTLAIFSVDISQDNRMLATADWAGYIEIWDIETGKVVKSLYPHGGSASYHVKFSPNGLYVISSGLDKKLKLIEVDTGEEIRTFKGHTELVNSINVSPSGDKIITSASDGTIRVWDFLSGLQVRKIKAHQGAVYSARFDSTGRYITSGGDDCLVKLWDANTGSLVSEFKGHQGGVGDVNMTSDQKYIISGSRDGSIRIWNVAEKREMLSMAFMNENDWFIKSPDGYFDASEGAYNSISFVKGTELYSIGQFFTEFYRPGLYRELFGGKQSALRQNLNNSISNFPPPAVEILTPENGSVMDNAIATCTVKVTNKGGGVKELKVMHNGKRQIVDDNDLSRMKKEGQYTTKSFDLNLVPGQNEIEVSAFSEGDIESEPISTTLQYKGLQKTSNCYIFSIGINKYENESLNLTYARPDAESVTEIISSQGKKLFNKIYTYTLFDKDATKPRIMATFDEISKTMKKEDVFIFFYAGHGSTVDNYFYFITSENTGLYQQEKLKNAIHVKELQEKFKQLPALKQVVFIDACHSGASVDLLAMRGDDQEKALAQLSRSSGIHVMASSESQQTSAEIQSLGHGVFTYVLLEALKGKADGSPKDSKVTVYELKSYIDDQVPELSFRLIRHKQFPSTFSIGHDFPLVVDN